MIIGAEKAASTSLLRYMGQHPELYASPQRAFEFIINPAEFEQGYGQAFARYFTGIRDGQRPVGKSVDILYSESALSRLSQIWPDIKVVISVRNPVDRAYSSFWMYYRKGAEQQKDFKSAIGLVSAPSGFRNKDGPLSIHLERGLYSKYLRKVLRLFRESQVSILRFEDITQNAVAMSKQMFSFVEGIDEDFAVEVAKAYNPFALPRNQAIAQILSNRQRAMIPKRVLRALIPRRRMDQFRDWLRQMNESKSRKPPLEDEVRNYLHEFYQVHNRDFSRLTGMEVAEWESTDLS